MQEGRKEVSLLCLLSQFPELGFYLQCKLSDQSSALDVVSCYSVRPRPCDVMLTCDFAVRVQHFCSNILRERRGSEIDCSRLKHLSCSRPMMSLSIFHFATALVSPLLGRQAQADSQLVVSRWDGSGDTENTVRGSIKHSGGSRGKILQRHSNIPRLPLHLQ